MVVIRKIKKKEKKRKEKQSLDGAICSFITRFVTMKYPTATKKITGLKIK